RRRDDEHPGAHLLRRPRHQELRRDRPRVVPLLPPPRPSRRAPLRVRAPLGPPALPRVRDPGRPADDRRAPPRTRAHRPPRGGAVTTPAGRARRWALTLLVVGHEADGSALFTVCVTG